MHFRIFKPKTNFQNKLEGAQIKENKIRVMRIELKKKSRQKIKSRQIKTKGNLNLL